MGRDEYYLTNPKHQLPSTPPPAGYMMNNGAVVYADLALNHHQRARAAAAAAAIPQHVPLPMYHPARAHTEYAVIKFHDVGQEIDV